MSRRTVVDGEAWPAACHEGIEEAIAEFRRRLPGWWYSLGECQVSCDASCSPTRLSEDIELIDHDARFDSGFHADLAQPSTLAMALREVMHDALEARSAARRTQALARDEGRDEHVVAYDHDPAALAAAFDALDRTAMRDFIMKAIGRRRRVGAALDVGAGSGCDARWLSSLGYRTTAAEPSEGMRAVGSSHPDNGDVEWIDTRLPDLARVPRGTQDLVLASAVWQHVDPARRARAFDVLLDVTAPGGLLFVMTRHGPASTGRAMHEVGTGEIMDHARRHGLGSVSSRPLPDAMGRDDVAWILWAMRKPRATRSGPC